jgi:hypothetical protein
VNLLLPLEAVQVNLPIDTLERLLASVDIRDADAVLRCKSAFSVYLNGVNLCIGKSVLPPISGLEAEVSVRENPVEPLIPGGENKIPGWEPEATSPILLSK